MKIKHWDTKRPVALPPQTGKWEQTQFGYYRLACCWSNEKKEIFAKQKAEVVANGYMGEREFEQDCFLSIVSDTKREHMNILELGAGYGAWCLALAGIIDYKVIPTKVKSYYCLGVEGEPTHYRWMEEHFKVQNINAQAVHGAISKEIGHCRFNAYNPDTWYGQAISFAMNSPESSMLKTNLRGLYSLFLGRTIKIPTFTVDYLAEKFKIDHIDIIHMDVQSAEYDVMLGAAKCIENDMIDYIQIGTHHSRFNDMLKQLLGPKFNLIVDIYPNSVGKVEGFLPIQCWDGVQVYKRKGI